jgi:hypothetical protein
MIEAIRQLSQRLAETSDKGDGFKLKSEDVEIALAALRALASAAAEEKNRARTAFAVEILDAQLWPQEMIATSSNEEIAHAAYLEAIKQRPDRIVRLRRGKEIIKTGTG